MSSYLVPFQKLWNIKIRVPYTLLIVGIMGFLLLRQNSELKAGHPPLSSSIVAHNDCPPAAVIQYRMSDYRFTRPLLIADVLNPSSDNTGDNQLNEVKNGIYAIIEGKKQSGQISNASVFVRKLNGKGQVAINGEELYKPAS